MDRRRGILTWVRGSVLYNCSGGCGEWEIGEEEHKRSKSGATLLILKNLETKIIV